MNATKYLHTYFRIEAGYVWGQGMSKEAGDTFDAEIREILGALGFTPKHIRDGSGSCTVMQRGKESLYCHPMDLSGYVLEPSIPEIEAAISKARTFKIRKIDSVHTAFDYSAEQMTARLEELRPALEENALRCFTTARKNLGKTMPLDAWLEWLRSHSDWMRDSDNDKTAKEWLWKTLAGLVETGKIKVIGKNKFNAEIYRTVKAA